MNNYIAFAFSAMVFWGIGDFLIQRSVKKCGSLETLFWITLASSIVLLPFSYNKLSSLSFFDFISLGVLGVVSFLASFVHFKALHVGKLSVIEIILSLELPLTILLGIFIFRENISLEQLIFIIFLFIGIILVSVNFQEKIKISKVLEKGVILAFLSAFLVASTNFLTAFNAKELDPILTIWFSWLICFLITVLFLGKKLGKRTFYKSANQSFVLLFIMIVADTIAWVSYAFALSSSKLSLVTAITESFVVIAFFLGILFNKEKIRFWQYVGAFLAVLSSIIIAFI